jgi:hypothetical protein
MGFLSWARRLFTEKAVSPSPTTSVLSAQEAHQSPDGAEGEVAYSYSSDRPISKRDEDRFNRWPFAARIADTLATRHDPSSVVVGIYGPWGDGKTSVLHLMEEALAAHRHVVIVRFNPWLFESEDKLLRGFFGVLARSIGRSLPTWREKLGEALQKYGALLSPVGAGDAAQDIGQTLSTVDIETLRERIEDILAQAGKRIVILIDDIDRLDRTEIHALFKLVKLSAGFTCTSYVLAFDDEMVAAALGEKYGQGGIEAGRRFLEKIVQVPLHLPSADQLELRRIVLEGVDDALNLSGIALMDADAEAFGRHFVDGLEPQLNTPRQAKLYANALTFALPLLKGEAHPVDHMLIEGVRVFYPKLYTAIRDNPGQFLQAESSQFEDRQAYREKVAATIDNTLNGIGVQDKKHVRQLLEVLFPRLRNAHYGSEWERQWAQEQQICSGQYFKRYFTYSVPPGDVGDLEVKGLLSAIGAGETDLSSTVLLDFAKRNGVAQLVKKLRQQEEAIEPLVAADLALLLARHGALIPREEGAFAFSTSFMQAGILVAHLLKRLTLPADRESVALQVLNEALPLPFAFECFRWISHHKESPESDRIVSQIAEDQLATAIMERIRSEAQKVPLYQAFGEDARGLLWLWNKYGVPGEVSGYLQRRFNQAGDEVGVFLQSYVGRAWGLESGLSQPADFSRESYDAIAKLVDPQLIMEHLKQRYGSELDTPEYHLGNDVALSRRIAHQFAFIHRAASQEEAKNAKSESENVEMGGE